MQTYAKMLISVTSGKIPPEVYIPLTNVNIYILSHFNFFWLKIAPFLNNQFQTAYVLNC